MPLPLYTVADRKAAVLPLFSMAPAARAHYVLMKPLYHALRVRLHYAALRAFLEAGLWPARVEH